MRHRIIFAQLWALYLVNFSRTGGASFIFDNFNSYDFANENDDLTDPSLLAMGQSWDSTSSVDNLNIEPDVANDVVFVDHQPDTNVDYTLFVR